MRYSAALGCEMRRVLLVVAGLASAGCGQGDPAPLPGTAASTVAAELSWPHQIEAVRTGTSRRIIVHDSPVAAGELADLAKGCEALAVLELDNVDTAAGSLDVFGRLPHLQRVKLGGAIDDAGIERLVGARQLAAVNLPDAEFSDRGLELLAGLPQLELLRFHSPHVTDAGLGHIARMPALRFLHLIDVPVTDAGLEHLHSLQRLESFYLDGGQCTDAGLHKLLQALPELHFHFNQLHLPGDPRADRHADADSRGPDGG